MLEKFYTVINFLDWLQTYISVHGGFVYKVTIDILGDPMVDYWQSPNEWIMTAGGAFNVYKNVESLTKDLKSIQLRSFFHSIENFNPQEARACGYPIKIYDCDKNWNINNNRNWTSDNAFFDSSNCKLKSLGQVKNFSILIVSDYNKGFVSKHIEKVLEDKFYNICIVDSRYANTDFQLLRKKSDCLIYRTTNKVDIKAIFEWDYMISTCGDQATRLFDQYEYNIIPIENISNTVCSIGCGDTFTATIASYLALQASIKEYWGQWNSDRYISNFSPNHTHISKAIKYAHMACQEVVSKPRTSITTLSLI